jgi:hypothetical protein
MEVAAGNQSIVDENEKNFFKELMTTQCTQCHGKNHLTFPTSLAAAIEANIVSSTREKIRLNLACSRENKQ